MNKILLTGGDGFIGKHLFNMDKSRFKLVSRKKIENSFHIDNLDSHTNWEGAFTNVDCIVHLAGLAHSNNSDDDYFSVNRDGTLKLAREAVQAGVKRFVFISTIGVNGSSTKKGFQFSPSCKVNPHNAYSRSKYEAESLLQTLSDETGLEVVIIRPTLVYGNTAPGNFGLLARIIKSTLVLPFGMVSNRRAFISVNNLCDLIFHCVENPNAKGHVFLASDCTHLSLKEFTSHISKGLGTKVMQLPIPVPILRLILRLVGKKAIASQLLDNLEVDSQHIFDAIGWIPPYSIEFEMEKLGINND